MRGVNRARISNMRTNQTRRKERATKNAKAREVLKKITQIEASKK